MKEKFRLSFLGDIMFEKYILDKKPENSDFNSMFSEVKSVLESSDIVLGNVETTFSGAEAGYTKKMYSFNTPDEAIRSLKNLGLDYAIVTNNHILDRGFEGRKRTIEKLENAGIKVLAKNDRLDVIDIEGVKISILPYTSSTNYVDNNVKLNFDEEIQLRLLNPYNYWESDFKPKSLKQKVHKLISGIIGPENMMKVKKTLGKKHKYPYTDMLLKSQEDRLEPYIQIVEKQMSQSKQISDITIVIPHMGGQFNKEPGTFSKHYMEIFRKFGAGIIIGSHPHILQKYENIENIPSFYSIGNFSMAPNSTYTILDDHPEVGIIVHLDINIAKKQIQDIIITPIIMKMKESFKVLPFFGSEMDKSKLDWLKATLKVDLEFINKTDLRIKEVL